VEPEQAPAEPEQPVAAEQNIQKNTSSPAEQADVLTAKTADEPVYIDVWRPAGRSEKRPPRARRPQRAAQTPVITANGGDVAAVAAAPVTAPETSEKSGDFRPKRQDRQERHERQQRVERQSKGLDRKPGGPPRGDRPRRDKGDRVEKAERDQYYAKPHGSSSGADRNKAPDPNSPFAKLAALKQQLEQNNKT
jgi:ATP-dependent RNA helicase SUPV3L1/SUV3